MLNVYFWNNEKMFQIHLKSYLKEKPYLKSRCCFTLLEPVMPGSWICLNPNMGKYALVCVTSKYVLICSIKIQNMHELLLGSVGNWLNMSTVLNMPE